MKHRLPVLRACLLAVLLLGTLLAATPAAAQNDAWRRQQDMQRSIEAERNRERMNADRQRARDLEIQRQRALDRERANDSNRKAQQGREQTERARTQGRSAEQQRAFKSSTGIAAQPKPPTPGEMKRGFTGKVMNDRALVKVRGRTYWVPASRVGYRKPVAGNSLKPIRATSWTPEKVKAVDASRQALAAQKAGAARRAGGGSGGGGGASPPRRAANDNSLLVIVSPAVQKRVDAATNEKLQRTNSEISFDQKIKRQLAERGWTEQLVQEISRGPAAGTTTDNRRSGSGVSGENRSDPATVYGTKEGYVVVNDITKEIVQVSDRTPGSKWIADSRIQWKKE